MGLSMKSEAEVFLDRMKQDVKILQVIDIYAWTEFAEYAIVILYFNSVYYIT